ncbi:hypothetical protein M9980_08175 [Sphingomonas donggukensis]|uniref:Uncharacterized protein n=1 Tax=Sphingomonas donggukensis TaxID=2949093 RepID=A0ABY4TTN4_9SPHN|nr:hypothetical protein [Sphingomonas donggukensis]URW74554.1 hypothetical protein M9980_08175 [Sphingomonas donggukensis]
MDWKTVAVVAQLLFWSGLIAWFQDGIAIQLLIFGLVFAGGAICYGLSRKHFGAWVDKSNQQIFSPHKGSDK